MQAITNDHAGLLIRPQRDGGFHPTTVSESGDVMQAKFNGVTVAVSAVVWSACCALGTS